MTGTASSATATRGPLLLGTSWRRKGVRPATSWTLRTSVLSHTREGSSEAPVAGFKRKRKLLLAARTLKVEEPAARDLAYTNRRDGAHTTLKTLRSRGKERKP